MERLQDKLETTDRDLGKFKQKSSFKLSHIGNIQNTVKESFQMKDSIYPNLDDFAPFENIDRKIVQKWK